MIEFLITLIVRLLKANLCKTLYLRSFFARAKNEPKKSPQKLGPKDFPQASNITIRAVKRNIPVSF
ncbi:hypothetical protein GCM10009123_18720 [Kangiella japonica]|uniref:Uncharacterized protein n=1 Tax=Kangiella japonica TaxID=647384 RepID=A0ABN0T3W9_9GAMM